MEKHFDTLTQEFKKTIEHLKIELAKVHTGRASAGLIEDLSVDYYGARMPLKSLASITVTAPKEIKVEVWDQNAIKSVSDTLTKASLGSLPQVEGRVIRINLPAMTGETREKMIKAVHDLMEKSKVSLRQSREKTWDDIQKLERDGEIREDDKFRLRDRIQELIDDYGKKIEEIGKGKEEELKT
ncbi:MAG: ribosome recycling factor [Candidatus Paceibacterota bacterium]|jgi:ribosome recycling factor